VSHPAANAKLARVSMESVAAAAPLEPTYRESAPLENRFGALLPGWLRRRLMIVETVIESEVAAFSKSLPPDSRVLDAGAGEGRYRDWFRHCRYVGVDLGIGDRQWTYAGLDVLGDLTRLPFPTGAFDAMVNIVVLEHTRQPDRVVAELARALRPGGRLLLIVPQQWEVHQQPNDYFRFTRYGLEWLLDQAGLSPLRLDPVGGYFTLLARRLLNGLNFFQGGARWLAFPLVAIVAGGCGLVLPALDFLDSEKHFTLAYVCIAEKK
jgi:SAM-dependent methyltransferase